MPDRFELPRAGTAARRLSALGVVVTMLVAATPGGGGGRADGLGIVAGAVDPLVSEAQHLLVSEVMTGGASASDEFIEIYNPGPQTLPLEGLEVVYVSAGGASVSRRATWPAGAAGIEAGRHVLIANAAGIFAGVAEVLYTSGLSATGGNVALRIQGASTAVDAVGWGASAASWTEGFAATPPAPGESIERLPGGALGSSQDTDDNRVDFVVRQPPDPQNSTSPPTPDPASPSPSPTASVVPTGTPLPTDTPTPTLPPPTVSATPAVSQSSTASPSPVVTATSSASPTPPSAIPIAEARALLNGSTAAISGVALTDSDFSDGGGYLADATGGIAVLLTGGGFARGDLVQASGVLDDRYRQRTLRVDAADLSVGGSTHDPTPIEVATGAVGESVEGGLVGLTGEIMGAPSQLSGATAFDLDDGSGTARVVVGSASGIDLSGWEPGAQLGLIGVVGQRDSTGTGSAGYRVQPRDEADVRWLHAPASPTSQASQTPGAEASSSGSQPSAAPTDSAWPEMSIAQTRAAGRGARSTVRGVVTLGTGTIDPDSAVVQDASGAILLRLAAEAGGLQRGQRVEVRGIGSTKSGMATLRVTEPPRQLGLAQQPDPLRRGTGSVAEADEAMLVVARGALLAAPRRASSGTVSLQIDDGSGPLRVVASQAAGVDTSALARGAWIEVQGIVGQETTTDAPLTGYRVWLRGRDDLRVLAGAVTSPLVTDEERGTAAGADTRGESSSAARGGLEALLHPSGLDRTDLLATLVAGPWPEVGVAGVLWDGVRAVGISDDAGARAGVASLARNGLPASIRFSARATGDVQSELGLPMTQLLPAHALQRAGAAIPPANSPPAEGYPTWVRVTGVLGEIDRAEEATRPRRLEAAHMAISVHVRCASEGPSLSNRLVVAEGLGLAAPPRLVVGCSGLRAAPTLATQTAAPDAAVASKPPGGRAADEVLDGHAGRGVALGLIGMALAMLVAGGLAAWRRRVRSGSDAAEVDRPASHGEPGASHLTLVELPRERGSP